MPHPSRVRVVQLVPNLAAAGAEWMVLHLASALDRTRYDVHIVSLFASSASAVEAAAADAGIGVHFLNKSLGFDPRVMWQVDRILHVLRPRLVHTHLGALQYALPAIVRRRQLRAVHTVHSLADQELPRSGRLVSRAALLAGVAPVAIANAVAKSFVQEYGRAAAALIPNGVPVQRFASQGAGRGACRAALGLADDSIVLVSVGRLSSEKRMDIVLRAFADAASQLPAARLLIIGEGPLLGELTTLATRLGLTERVQFLGLRGDVPTLLAASDVFVLASDLEGHPLSVMEAMSAGLPAIATAVGGVPEIVGDGVSGLLAPAGDVGAVAGHIRTLLTDSALRSTMGRAAQERAVAEFDVSVMAERYHQLYQRLLAP